MNQPINDNATTLYWDLLNARLDFEKALNTLLEQRAEAERDAWIRCMRGAENDAERPT